jgi:uroporphyrin-III C-methyltransferase/precorrin-2 dehydrogenase/sirohydrochlorin ferrochelatase
MTVHVTPNETQPGRLATLAKLPIFLDLKGKRVVLAGVGEPLLWKAELLAAAGAQVDIFTTDPALLSGALAAGSGGLIRIVRRHWQGNDLDGAWLAVADAKNDQEAADFAQAGRRCGALVNVIDRPDTCDFQFGTIINRSPVVVGISTDGAAPILGQAIRRRVEAVLPMALGSWASAAKQFRASLKKVLPSRTDRRLFWEQFVDAVFGTQGTQDDHADRLEHLAAKVRTARSDEPRIGEIVIVGAGPGDPELLTLKAMRELQAADIIVYDRLVTPGILELARREARRIHVGKEGHGASCRQDDINDLLVDLALAGNRVVRLKGGDPAIFGRVGEEVEACRNAGIPVRIVPGITAASAAAASLGLSLTHRDHAQRVQFVTGHDRFGDLPKELNTSALTDPHVATVIYMGRRTAPKLAKRLLEDGLSADTPVVAVSDVARPSQTQLATCLDDLARGCPLPGDGPLIVLIGSSFRVPEDAAAQTGSVRKFRESAHADLHP